VRRVVVIFAEKIPVAANFLKIAETNPH